MPKQYGQDGPPQLHRINVHLTNSDQAILQRTDEYSHLLNLDQCWRRKIACSCGNDEFRILRADSDSPGWIKGEYTGSERIRAECGRCGESHLLFDDGLHGYNAVCCDDRSQLPANYEQNNDALLTVLKYPCGHDRFRVFAAVVYDCLDSEDLEETPEVQWDDAYGYFLALAVCLNCEKTHQVAGSETA